jgi:hypothetical protein
MSVFLIGFGVGVFGGMLMAPHRGRYYGDLVQGLGTIKDKTAGLADGASGVVGKGRDVVAQQIERIACSTTPAETYQR